MSNSIENKDDNSILLILNIIQHINLFQYGKDMMKEKVDDFSYLSINFISKYPKDSTIVKMYQNIKTKIDPKEDLVVENM